MRISNIVIHPEPELSPDTTVPDKIRYVLVGDLLPADTGDDTEEFLLCLGHDFRCEDSPAAKRVVAVDDDNLFSLKVQCRERPQPAQAHGTGSDTLFPEQVDGHLGLFSESSHGDNDHIRVPALVFLGISILPAKPFGKIPFGRFNDLYGIPHRALDIPAHFEVL